MNNPTLNTFDDKGKVFTPVVTKKPVPIQLQTNQHRIVGMLHVRPDHRLKDELDTSTNFIAVTDAVVYDLNGEKVMHSDFILINIGQVVWLAPNDEA